MQVAARQLNVIHSYVWISQHSKRNLAENSLFITDSKGCRNPTTIYDIWLNNRLPVWCDQPTRHSVHFRFRKTACLLLLVSRSVIGIILLSVCLSVTLCIMALRVGVHGWQPIVLLQAVRSAITAIAELLVLPAVSVVVKDLRLKDKDKDLMSKDEDKDEDLSFKDNVKDKDWAGINTHMWHFLSAQSKKSCH